MSVKLIATDLDGTLMYTDHITVTERTKNSLLKAHEKGVKLAIATGRTLGFIGNVIKQIPFVDYVIFSNGATVYDLQNKKSIFENHISNEVTGEIIETLEKLPLYYNMYVGGEIYVPTHKEKYYFNETIPKVFLDEFMSLSNRVDNTLNVLDGRGAEIIAIYNIPENEHKHLSGFFAEKGLYVTSSIPGEIEITAPGVNKGTALEGFSKNTGIALSDMMAFGDMMNDAEMLKAVGESFAMGNAHDDVKAVAKHTTLSNADDGVAVAIEKYVLEG